MAEGVFTKLRRSRSNRISAKLRELQIKAEVETPSRGDAGVTTVREFDAGAAAALERAVRDSVGDSAEVELLIAITWK